LLLRLAVGVVELLGKQRLGLLGLQHGLLHSLQQFVQFLLLLAQAVLDLLAPACVAERAGVRRRFLQFCQTLPQLLLSFVQLGRRVAQPSHFFLEAPGRLLAELVADLLQFTFRARARGDGPREHALLQRFRRLPYVLARLLEILPSLGHAGLILGLVHP